MTSDVLHVINLKIIDSKAVHKVHLTFQYRQSYTWSFSFCYFSSLLLFFFFFKHGCDIKYIWPKWRREYFRCRQRICWQYFLGFVFQSHLKRITDEHLNEFKNPKYPVTVFIRWKLAWTAWRTSGESIGAVL